MFETFLENLKIKNRVKPAVIVLSDSSNVLTSALNKNITATNDFCPAYIVMFIRHKLFQILHRVFGNDTAKDTSKFNEFPKM